MMRSRNSAGAAAAAMLLCGLPALAQTPVEGHIQELWVNDGQTGNVAWIRLPTNFSTICSIDPASERRQRVDRHGPYALKGAKNNGQAVGVTANGCSNGYPRMVSIDIVPRHRRGTSRHPIN